MFLQIADMLTEICVDAVLAITPADEKTPLDLHMVELMDMQHRSEQVNIKLWIWYNWSYVVVKNKSR